MAEAIDQLRHLPFEDLGFAKVDHHRAMRHGMPEVIFGKGKTPEQILRIAQALLAKSQNVLVTRASPEAAELLMKTEPGRRSTSRFQAWCDSGATGPSSARAGSP